jgi:hypothetical protein
MNKNDLIEKNFQNFTNENEIAYLLHWNFRNKFKNNFKPNEMQTFSKNAYFWKTGHIFLSKKFLGQFKHRN